MIDHLYPAVLGPVYNPESVFESLERAKMEKLDDYVDGVVFQICNYPRSTPVYQSFKKIMDHYRGNQALKNVMINQFGEAQVDAKITELLRGFICGLNLSGPIFVSPATVRLKQRTEVFPQRKTSGGHSGPFCGRGSLLRTTYSLLCRPKKLI